MADPTPPVLHRAALERVLQRAAELQAASTEVPETLTEAELVALGAEVGLSATALRQALLEERMRVVLPEERGWLAVLAGPATFVATRIVSGAPREVLTKLHTVMSSEENLRELRRFPRSRRLGSAGRIRRCDPLAHTARRTRLSARAGRRGERHGRRGRRRTRAHPAGGDAAWPSGAGAVRKSTTARADAQRHRASAAVASRMNAWLPDGLGRRGRASRARCLRPSPRAATTAAMPTTPSWPLEQILDRLEFGEASKKRKLFSG
jgi:hypothetical protein